MLFPIGDDDRRLTGTPYVTGSIVLALFAIFALGQRWGEAEDFTLAFAAVPYELTTWQDLVGPVEATLAGEPVVTEHQPGPVPLTAITALLLHSGLIHLGGNAFFLWIFGNNVELHLGRLRFAGLFLLSGLAGIAIHVAAEPASTVPLIGASGSVAGVLGAYGVLFPRNRVYVLFLFRVITIPAVLAVGLWGALQVAGGLGTWYLNGPGTGAAVVSFTAHVGGLLTGMLVGGVARWRGRTGRARKWGRATG
jgi:membrane associated rhomboid family serine protease